MDWVASSSGIVGRGFCACLLPKSPIASGFWPLCFLRGGVRRRRNALFMRSGRTVLPSKPYILPSSRTQAGGGGGGGDRDKMAASKGSPPKFAREQIAPPVVVVRNENPVVLARQPSAFSQFLAPALILDLFLRRCYIRGFLANDLWPMAHFE
jgi:hypothetical protein